HCVGAPKLLNAKAILDELDTLARSRMFLLGYYSLMPALEPSLPEVFARIRETGCKTALDAAGSGGAMQPLDRILPHLDVYVPSLAEAKHQTGLDDPCQIIDVYRNCGAPGLLGVKLGSRGVMLSPKAGEYVQTPIVPPPGEVIDTTGAGDSFYAGLLTGLIKGLSIEDAAKLGVAAGACCVTAVGGWAGSWA
ncbi:MAG: PfkB family carbohydrate kinase, partial [Phycisphaeraceae bacterium]